MIVTGASSGIGEATARLAAKAGARLVLAARRADRLQRLALELPDAIAVTTDMRVPDQVRALVATAEDHYGRVDVLINNAGQGYHVPVEKVTLEDFQAIIELNVYGPLVALQAVLPLMRHQGGGSIVNVSSGTVRGAWPGVGPYASSKAALTHLSRVARNELAAEGIVVSTVFPYVTATEFHEALRGGALRQPPPGGTGRPPVHPPELVAEAILQLVRSGEEEIVLTPQSPR
jgi:NAD(P)-dependent dehydrogenase (short-subunit alcohol dehydrogenase family)